MLSFEPDPRSTSILDDERVSSRISMAALANPEATPINSTLVAIEIAIRRLKT